MGCGQFVYRRGSGIHVARVSIPAQFQDRLGRREIHLSIGQRSRQVALSSASAVADCWRSVFSGPAHLDALKVAHGLPPLVGARFIHLVDAARALGVEPHGLALG